MKSLAAFALSFALTTITAVAITPAPGSGARFLPLAGDAFAGSSVNVLAGLQNTLFTEGNTQYAAFYASDATLVLARRTLGQDKWETVRTPYRGNVTDAHNTIAMAIDGDGYLHLAWDHHANALKYARSVAPGSLELGPPQAMTALREDSVTYPLFHRLPGGDLLFLYRDGRSGRGNLVLNRYTTNTRTWSQIHSNLIDGEDQRSAYPSVFVDRKGVLHLAWNWRDSADVATNHDLCYAKSADGGVTWTTTGGAPLTIPLKASNAEYALRIPTGRSLMNPPALSVDSAGRPLIANYWKPDGSDVPQYHLLRHDGQEWRVQQVTHRTAPFTLAGTNTKRPPISRSIITTRREWKKPQEVFLIYRDDERGGRAVVAACPDIEATAPAWTITDLTADSLGAWEPSLDPVQTARLDQVHLLVQSVEQRDGNDSQSAPVPPSMIGSLIWKPFSGATATATTSPLPVPNAGALGRPIVATDVLALMEKAADWQLTNPSKYSPTGWENAPFYIGALALAEISGQTKYHDAILAQCEANAWKPGPRVYNADDHCVLQACLSLYQKHRDPKMLAPARARLDAILEKPSPSTLDWDSPRATDRWSWCDALFMGPASWLMLAQATEDARYVEFMNREWWATTAALYVPRDRLFARDQSFLDMREPNGRGLYWARGNGWVIAGLARVLDLFPHAHPDYPRYVALYRELAESILTAQQPDGLWRPGLLDPAAHPVQETSGTSFNTFALAWGINRGLLDRSRFEPAVRRSWNALATCVNADGKLEHVQPVGAAPEGFEPFHSEPFGVGAFLLAGREIHRLVSTKAP
jgi:rhamnogalacturonyl hydrolase YesR